MRHVFLGVLWLLLLPHPAEAHILSGDGGFWSGLTHPVLGFDHFLAMLSVGILSAQLGGRAIWTVPATFVTVMAVGAFVGMRGIEIPAVEYGIALSVLVLGFSLALGKRIVPVWAMLGVGFFAIFHGHAHGTEMPNIVRPLIYAIGFLLGTAAIHLSGVLVGVVSCRTAKGAEILRFAGAGIAGIGVHILYFLIRY